MLRSLVEKGLTQFEEQFDNWEDAVKASYETMLAQNIVEEVYVEQVVKCIKEFGPYIILIPNVAMPHSSQGAEGVNQSAVSFMKVEKPVSFEEGNSEKDAQLFFSLSALDSNQHMQNIMNLSELLMNEEVVNALKEAKNNDDLIKIADQYNLN